MTISYTSWSFDAQRALDFAQNWCILLYAHLPVDVPAFYIDGAKHTGLYQHEIVLTRDVTFTIEHTAVLIYNGTPRTCTKTYHT